MGLSKEHAQEDGYLVGWHGRASLRRSVAQTCTGSLGQARTVLGTPAPTRPVGCQNRTGLRNRARGARSGPREPGPEETPPAWTLGPASSRLSVIAEPSLGRFTSTSAPPSRMSVCSAPSELSASRACRPAAPPRTRESATACEISLMLPGKEERCAGWWAKQEERPSGMRQLRAPPRPSKGGPACSSERRTRGMPPSRPALRDKIRNIALCQGTRTRTCTGTHLYPWLYYP